MQKCKKKVSNMNIQNSPILTNYGSNEINTFSLCAIYLPRLQKIDYFFLLALRNLLNINKHIVTLTIWILFVLEKCICKLKSVMTRELNMKQVHIALIAVYIQSFKILKIIGIWICNVK